MIDVIVKGEIKLDVPITSAKLMGQIGGQAIAIIRERTQRGKDYKGQRFVRYSTIPGWYKSPIHKKAKYYPGGYAEFKRKYYGRTVVDLLLTGQMLNNLKIKRKKKDSVLIGFTTPSQQAKAVYHNVTGAGKKRVKRKFMNIVLKRELNILVEVYKRYLRKQIRKLGK